MINLFPTKSIKQTTVIFLFVILGIQVFAQEGAYWVGLSTKNPAAIGTPSDWVFGVYSFPSEIRGEKTWSYGISADYRISPKAGSVGLTYLKEEIGNAQFSSVDGCYAYSLSMKNAGELHLGILVGLNNLNIDLNERYYPPETGYRSLPDLEAEYLGTALGAFYSSSKLDFGLSYNLYSELSSDIDIKPWANALTVLGAYRFVVQEKLLIEPNMLCDFAKDENDVYLGLYFEYNDRFWTGYTNMDKGEMHSFIGGVDIVNKVRLGYSYSVYDVEFGEMKLHELVLGFKIQ